MGDGLYPFSLPVMVHLRAERVRHVADGEADDGRSPGTCQRDSEEPPSCGHAGGVYTAGSQLPGKQVRGEGRLSKGEIGVTDLSAFPS